ncbi:allantoinase [Puccinia graminis f. sp. tritici CRL 75-36-700-3]|uniref:Allantoinase n=1 Tax=Puccinia graminis f. sp. tritici (strain CRL 75-36-700-3 / race SCCL) TaxID=418459 RepID=E3KUQ4_PUCGT|nr:allantoinase [Puccinia graminis f. sp. tritici CRL 75-36-700-3]EFP88004.2 allantoinase [Puccinia graminis f. sp. tritici CRL 75-36-700-3]
MKTMPRPSTVRQVVYAIERAMLPSPGGRTVDGITAERPSEAQEERFSEPQPATIEASIDTGLITAIRPGIVPRESYGADSVEYHLLPAPLIVFPGLVDPHVHLNEPGRTDWEGFETGTNAAAAGGVTTLVDMPLNAIPPTTTLANLNEKVRAAEGQCLVDVAFWGGVIPGNQDDLLPLVKAGVKGFKCFLIDSGVDEFPCVSAEDLEKSMAILQDADSMLMFHGELDCGEESGTSAELLKESQAQDPNLYASFLGSRAPKLELDAIELIIRLNKKYPNLRTHVVHLSAADALPMIREARTTHGLPLTTETCLHYLTLSTEEIPDGRAEYKCCPPIRTAANGDKLWEGLEEGTIDFVVSDHSPSRRRSSRRRAV